MLQNVAVQGTSGKSGTSAAAGELVTRAQLPDERLLAWVLHEVGHLIDERVGRRSGRRSVGQTGSAVRVERVEFLPGGSVSVIHRVWLARADGERVAVVLRRRPDLADGRNRGGGGGEGCSEGGGEPDLVQEAAALRMAARNALPAPRLLALDATGAQAGCPALVMSALPGRPGQAGAWGPAGQVRSRPGPLAAVLARVHAVERADDVTLPLFRYYNDATTLAVPRHAGDAGIWREAFSVARAHVGPVGPVAPEVLVHRDLNPGNVLWADGRVTGVVDWGAACWGRPGADLAHLRWNLALAHGPGAAREMLDAYRAAVPGYRHDRVQDLRAVLDLLPETALHRLDPAVTAGLENYLREVLGPDQDAGRSQAGKSW